MNIPCNQESVCVCVCVNTLTQSHLKTVIRQGLQEKQQVLCTEGLLTFEIAINKLVTLVSVSREGLQDPHFEKLNLIYKHLLG